MLAIQAIFEVLNLLMTTIYGDYIERLLTRQLLIAQRYNYIHKELEEDHQHFRQLYMIYLDVFLNLCNIIREKMHLQDTIFICIVEKITTVLLVICQNSQYRMTHETFSQSHYNEPKTLTKF